MSKPSPRSRTVEVYYTPGISVNHYRGRRADGRDFVRGDVQTWKDALGWLIKCSHIEDWNLPLTVSCKAIFPDRRRRDSSNLSKCVLDAIQEVTGIDDSHMLWRDETPEVGADARLILTITETK